MTSSKRMLAWAKNRAGLQTNPMDLPFHTQDSIDQNRTGPDFTRTFGKKDFFGIVGFIDLKGYSVKSAGKSAQEISIFIKPFLVMCTTLLTENGCLIDKTIGDEIMFVLPQIETGWVAYFDLFKILRKLKDYAYNNDEEYKFRIGISYGNMYLDVIETENYSEWFISGEPIIAAKRIMTDKKLAEPNPCVIGVCQKMENRVDLESFCDGLEQFGTSGWKKNGKIRNIFTKGLGNVSIQILSPIRILSDTAKVEIN